MKSQWAAVCLLAFITSCGDVVVDHQGSDLSDKDGNDIFATHDSYAPQDVEEDRFDGEEISVRFFYDANSCTAKAAQQLARDYPEDKDLFEQVARQPTAMWLGEWSQPRDVAWVMAAARARGEIPVFVFYNIPDRDCSGFSSGGAEDTGAYRLWVSDTLSEFDGQEVWVIVEPDALALSTACLGDTEVGERFELIAWTAEELEAAGAQVYLDIGHSDWLTPDEAAGLLSSAGVENARGFSLNVSNFQPTADCEDYGVLVAELLNGWNPRFVIDTSRNGNGPSPDGQWCNPAGRALGTFPTSFSQQPLADAYLWVKVPGESDGECNGGPPAGECSPEILHELVLNMRQ